MTATTVQFLLQDRSIRAEFRAGVSLHSHTMYSEESLDMIPRYAGRLPVFGTIVRKQEARRRQTNQEPLDFSRAFWTPPLSPREAYSLEQKQIERELNLRALVSLTDHDDIRASLHLGVLEEYAGVPVSTEWTAPFGPTFFHLGVHNLPAAEASSITKELASFTANPRKERLGELLEWLHSMPAVLVVLNHPLWDEAEIGVASHAHALGRFLERHGSRLHALEVNGVRPWKENRKIIEFGRESGLPVMSGGDRHGLEPNAVLNLTAAETLAEFVEEVRNGRSHVLFMPHYHEPMRLRLFQTVIDVLRDYPDGPETRRSWTGRVFYRQNDDAPPVPLSQYWPHGGPFAIQAFVKAIRLGEFRGVRSALRFALNDRTAWSDQGALV